VGGIPPTSPVWSRDAPVAANAPRSDKPPTVPESSCWPNLPGPQPTGHQLAGRKVLQIGSSVAMGKKQSLQSLEYDFYKGRSPVTGVSPTSHFTGWDIYIGTGTLLPFQCNPNPVTPRYISAPGGPPKPPTVPNHHVPPYPRPNPTPSQPHPARSRRAQVPRPPTVPHATNGGGLGAHPLPHPTMGAALGAPTAPAQKGPPNPVIFGYVGGPVGGIPPISPMESRDVPGAGNAPRSHKPPTVHSPPQPAHRAQVRKPPTVPRGRTQSPTGRGYKGTSRPDPHTESLCCRGPGRPPAGGAGENTTPPSFPHRPRPPPEPGFLGDA
jgi:hypothetical protein